jgi:hypothetical protein
MDQSISEVDAILSAPLRIAQIRPERGARLAEVDLGDRFRVAETFAPVADSGHRLQLPPSAPRRYTAIAGC